MNVNLPLSSSFTAGDAVRTSSASGGVATGAASEASDKRPAFVVTEAPSGASGVEEIGDEVLRRDDDLGRLVSMAFNLPPPQMPAFLAT